MRTAVSAMFAVQLLISSFCIITPATAMEAISSDHCHEQMTMHQTMSDSSKSVSQQTAPKNSDHVCTHCDSPQNLNTISHVFDLAPAQMLLAYVTPFSGVMTAVAGETNSPAKAQAPPDSSTLLLTTTQRLRI